MRAVMSRARSAGVTHVAFGDLFLQDVRDYRIRMMAGTGLDPMFPIWGSPADTAALATTMMEAGVKAILTCIDPRHLPESFAGRQFDRALLAELPPGVDPCGERGEFHTFCYAGPMFGREIAVDTGEVVRRDGFCFIDAIGTAGAVAQRWPPTTASTA
jgi:diphthamide synthase (EF-2-diphthine--ammonia ligase)